MYHHYSILLQGLHPIAQRHIKRVVADGGTIPDQDRLNDAVIALTQIYGPDLTAMVAACIDAHVFGYKIGTGSGTTLNGRATQKLYSLMGAASDVVQNTVAAQPLLLRCEGEKYFFSTTTNGSNTVSTDTNFEFSGDFTVITKVNKWTSGSGEYWGKISGGGGHNLSFGQSGPNLRFAYGVVFPFIVDVTWAFDHTPYLNSDIWFRVSRLGNDYTCSFSLDGINYTSLGTKTNTGVIPNYSSQIRGSLLGSSVLAIETTGKGYYTEFYSDATSTNLELNFNANDYDISISQNTLTSSTTGEVWTINRSTANTGYKAQLIYRTTVQYDGVDDYLKTAAPVVYSGTTECSEYMAFDVFDLTSTQRLKDGYGSNTADVLKTSIGYAIGQGAPPIATLPSNRTTVNIHRWSSVAGEAYIKVNGTTKYSGVTTRLVQGLTIGCKGDNLVFSNFALNSYIAPKQQDSTATENAVNGLMRNWNGNPLA